jgi:hypothetical protein
MKKIRTAIRFVSINLLKFATGVGDSRVASLIANILANFRKKIEISPMG